MDDTYGFDDNTDLYDPNMDVSIDDTDRLIEDIERVQGNFEDALTKAQKWFKVPFEKTAEKESGVDVMLENVGESDMMMERDDSPDETPIPDEIPIKMVAIEIDHNLVPNNTNNDSTDSSSQSQSITLKIIYAIYFLPFLF